MHPMVSSMLAPFIISLEFMKNMPRQYSYLLTVTLLVFSSPLSPAFFAQSIDEPSEFFGFKIGTDGELASYPKVLEYFSHLAALSDRVEFEERGKTTNNHPYVLVKFSSPENLARLDRLVEINHQLSDPRNLSPDHAKLLTREGVPFYFLYATIHSNEVGNGQSIIEIAHRLATDNSEEINEILNNTVLLLVPSQNPDGQVLVVDHWYETQGTNHNRLYPDLYHRYTGHDDNRDWFMFTQKETRLAIEIHKEYKPQVTHDMHQMGPHGARIFVPPFQEPHDKNIHPLLIKGQEQIGTAMSSALISAGKTGVIYNDQYDLWSPARQYMLYHGQPRILTEIASARLADPFYNLAGLGRPLGPQRPRDNFPIPYDKNVWRLADIVDYGKIVVFAGLKQMANHRSQWLENFFKVHKDWVDRDQSPHAFVIPFTQHDPFETFKLLSILDFAEVEIHRAKTAFTADGKTYPKGSWLIQLAQPYGAFAKTMLETQSYPDLRRYPGGPPVPPYDVTAHTLGLMMGVDVRKIEEPVKGSFELLSEIIVPQTPFPSKPKWAYAISPSSNASFVATSRLQAAGIQIFRTASEVTLLEDKTFNPGAWIIPATDQVEDILKTVAHETGLSVSGIDQPPSVQAYRLKTKPRVGLWRAANNIPAGWMKWLFEEYEIVHEDISAHDFSEPLSDKYDVIVLPSGTTRQRIITGLNPRRHDESWSWAFGIGESGWVQLRQWVLDGGTLIALGNAVETARELLNLPIEPVLPSANRATVTTSRSTNDQELPESEVARPPTNTFQNPTELAATLHDDVDPTSAFYCPGSLLKQEHNPNHPVGFGMPKNWPIFFRLDQAYNLTSSFNIGAEVISRYPDVQDMTASGWLLGGELLRNKVNVASFTVGQGNVVTLGSQVTFRAQTRATFKLLFNAIFQNQSTLITQEQLASLD